MIYITQLIYVNEGQEAAFDEFETLAEPLIEKHAGSVLLRVRPEKKSVIESAIEQPYEIHFLSFESEPNFQEFMVDEERKKLIHLKEQSVRSSFLVKGQKL